MKKKETAKEIQSQEEESLTPWRVRRRLLTAHGQPVLLSCKLQP